MSFKVILSAILLGALMPGVSRAQSLQDPWEESYANLDATGPQVLACWKFDELPLSDASGHGTQLYLKAATLQPQGRFGGGVTFRTKAGKGRYVALTQPSIARLSPAGAFSRKHPTCCGAASARVTRTIAFRSSFSLHDEHDASVESVYLTW